MCRSANVVRSVLALAVAFYGIYLAAPLLNMLR